MALRKVRAADALRRIDRRDPFGIGDLPRDSTGETLPLLDEPGGDRYALGRKRKSSGPRDDSGEREFAFQCRTYRLPLLKAQMRLERSDQELRKDGRPRVWVFDFVFVNHGIIVEIDGGVWIGGAHGHPLDLTRNMKKRNDAALAGYLILAFTPREVKIGHAIAFTQRVLATRGWPGPI
jgi:very-short-patch-repair endonuclease